MSLAKIVRIMLALPIAPPRAVTIAARPVPVPKGAVQTRAVPTADQRTVGTRATVRAAAIVRVRRPMPVALRQTDPVA